MSEAVLSPLPGRLTVTDPEEGLYDIEIPVRLVITSLVDPEFFPRGQPTVSIEDVDLGVADVRKLQGKEITFKRDACTDASFYLGGVHTPVRLYRLRFGNKRADRVATELELGFDFGCVIPRPPELPASMRVVWKVSLSLEE